jgi:hypothetical protein
MRPGAFGALAGIVFGLGAATAVILTGPGAEAKSAYDSPYGYDRTWNAATRLVRVDMGLKVTEKDDASGYLLFEYHSAEGGSKTSPGSIELVRSADPIAAVHVIVQLPSMPRYHEQVLLDGLVRKMKDDYGEPPTARMRSRSAVDAGATKDAEP